MSNEPPLNLWKMDNGVPPGLRPHLGKLVYRAWILPGGRVLLLKLEGGLMISAEGVATDKPGYVAVELDIGTERPGVTWDDLKHCENAYCRFLRGKRLTGMDGDTLVFDEHYGACFTPNGIQWRQKQER